MLKNGANSRRGGATWSRICARRSAFTLLEVLLALAIASLLLYALYTAVEIQLRHQQTARDVVEQSQLARALLRRIANDITPSLAPTLPPTASQGQGGGAGGAAAAAAPAAGATTTTGGATTTPAAPMTTALAGNAVVFNQGAQGDNTTLTLYISRWPREVNFDTQLATDPGTQSQLSDLRRISYVLDSDRGLLRQEIKLATSDDALNAPSPMLDDGYTSVLAEEVKSIQFQYWDGSNWQDSWDGTQPGADGSTPQGPPLAIAITVGIALTSDSRYGGGQVVKQYRHVVALPTANGLSQNTTTSSP